jgi:hypothetical protein
LLEKNLAIASYTKALFVQKWQMFSESDRRGIEKNLAISFAGAVGNRFVYKSSLRSEMANVFGE